MKRLSLMVLLSMPAHGSAQPFSDSMADCAAFYQNTAQYVSDDKVERVMQAARQWADAAIEQRQAEGKSATWDSIWVEIDAQADVWHAQGAKFIMTQEFRDWAAYCRAFAKDRGIDLGI